MSWLDIRLATAFSRETRLRDVLKQQATEFDIVILDCPPSLGLSTQNAFVAAKYILIPLFADKFAVDGLVQIVRFFNMIKTNLNKPLQLLGMLITQYEKNTLTKAALETLQSKYNNFLFNTKIRRNVTVGKAHFTNQALMDYDPYCAAALDYKLLFKEVVARLNITNNK